MGRLPEENAEDCMYGRRGNLEGRAQEINNGDCDRPVDELAHIEGWNILVHKGMFAHIEGLDVLVHNELAHIEGGNVP